MESERTTCQIFQCWTERSVGIIAHWENGAVIVAVMVAIASILVRLSKPIPCSALQVYGQ